jgi:hypothetical protein
MTRRTAFAALALCLTGAVAVALTSLPAEAGRLLRRAPEGDVAVAVSRFGNGSVSGPVRRTSTGYEVRLPSGTWIACRTRCSETLRVQTVDILETNGNLSGYGSMQNECGIFGCLDFSYPR